MSIERRQRKKGTVYVVWWREGSRNRNRTFDRKRDAEAFEAKIKLLKRSGDLIGLDSSRASLSDLVTEWWETHALLQLSPHTLASYAFLRDRYVLPKLGHLPLAQLTPQRVQRFKTELTGEGVGQESVRRTLAMLQGILQRAVEWEQLPRNPVKAVAKPTGTRTRLPHAFPPQTVERLRSHFLHRGRHRDATLIGTLAYAGVRPGEALALTWRDVAAQTIVVERSLAFGSPKETKTGKARSVRLMKPLATDLTEWRLASGCSKENEPVFPSTRSGGFWTDSMYRNWRRKHYVAAAEAAGTDSTRPYDLRHCCASLLFQEGVNPAEIAEQMGHSLPTLLTAYAHVIDELRGLERRPAETLIREARERMVTFPSHTAGIST